MPGSFFISFHFYFTTFVSMQQLKSNWILLVQRMLLLLFFYTLCRGLFLLFNFSYFREVPVSALLADFFFGLRFDLSAIVISNLVFISLHVNPFPFFHHRYYQRVLKIIFILVNTPFLLFYCIDFGLFRFSAKHATGDLLKVMSFGEDFVNTVPLMIRDFWYMLLVFFILCFALVLAYNRISLHKRSSGSVPVGSTRTMKIVNSLVAIVLIVIGFRGGIQYKPVSIISASRYGTAKDVALILNTPFTILKTIGKVQLAEMNYYSTAEAEKISPVHHLHSPGDSFRNLNVVIIILESFGKEYIGSLNHGKGYTPFLDSLAGESLVFSNAFANGKRSIEGIPSIVAGIPSLMSDPFIASAYSGNSISSLASLLKRKGYLTAFYHGGTNGTMGFDNFTHLAGFDYYYGRKEYNNDQDFDGNWGIYDEPFLQRFAQQMDRMKEPFFTTVFTLSSHHPYSIPVELKNKFPFGTLPIHQSIGYADYSLKMFFETASKMKWFDHTLFVLTADHTALSEYPFYQSKVGMYSIPIIFYRHDSELKGSSDITAQQIDILPSVLDYLHFDQSFFAFGESVFDSTTGHFAVNYLNDTHQLISDDYSFTLDSQKNNFLYHYTSDSTLQHNVISADTLAAKKMERKLKAVIQNYNAALIHNDMVEKHPAAK